MRGKREGKMRKQVALVIALIAFGVILLTWGLYTGFVIGSEWFGHGASSPWHMNNYIVIEAKYAYIFFGLATLAFGGLATGIAMPHLLGLTKSKGHRVASACSFFVAILLTGLGFNTLDFMLGSFYWTNMRYPPPVAIPIIGSVDVWNYYFFFFVVPLWLGGFIMGLATSYSACIYQPLASKLTIKTSFNKKLNLQSFQKSSRSKEYMVESKPLSRSN